MKISIQSEVVLALDVFDLIVCLTPLRRGFFLQHRFRRKGTACRALSIPRNIMGTACRAPTAKSYFPYIFGRLKLP
jgi:hypothetical protein